MEIFFEVIQCQSKPPKFFSCKVIDIRIYQVLGQRIPQNGHFGPTDSLYHDLHPKLNKEIIKKSSKQHIFDRRI